MQRSLHMDKLDLGKHTPLEGAMLVRLSTHFPFYSVCEDFISFVTECCFIGCALFDFVLLMSLGLSPVLVAPNAGVWPSV